MEIGLLQYDVLRDREANLQKAEAFLEKNQCELLLLPELAMGGYLFESRKALMAASEAVPEGASTKAMCALSRVHDCTIVFGLAEGEGIYNTAVVVSRGSYVGKYRKIHLSDLEKKLFDRGRENPVFEVGGLKIGAQICFDLWFPEISREQLRQGAEVLCVLANFGGDTTYHISRIRAIENLPPWCCATGWGGRPSRGWRRLPASGSMWPRRKWRMGLFAGLRQDSPMAM